MPISKQARIVRVAEEFTLARLQAETKAPPSTPVLAWDLAAIFAARDQQRLGMFTRAAQLAEAMRTDDALAVAYKNRLAPQRCITVDIKPPEGRRAKAIAAEAEALYGASGIALRPEVLADINGCLANHGVAVGINEARVREDGSRVDLYHSYWPIEHVYWDEFRRTLRARVDQGPDEDITHGDGRWVVYAGHSWKPWAQDAAILSAAAVWGRHAFANRDWAKGSVAHGNAKIIGELPEGVPLQGEDGALSEDAAAFIELLNDMATRELPIGIRPAGSKTDFITNNSGAWQVWKELVQNAEKAAARIYLGTDGILGSQGGAPGVDIQSLFGVAQTIVEGDLRAIERAVDEGILAPWCALNFGDSKLAPQRKYRIPDRDSDAARESDHVRRGYLFEDIKRMKETGLPIAQAVVDELALSYGVPTLIIPAEKTDTGAIVLAPTDIASVITVNEARASLSLPPLPGPDGELPMAAYAAKSATRPAPVAAPASPEAAHAPAALAPSGNNS